MSTLGAKFNFVTLSKNVRLRKEYFGGILFDVDTGSIVEVDREAFQLVSLIRDIGIADLRGLSIPQISTIGPGLTETKIRAVISLLTALGFFRIMPPGILSTDVGKALAEPGRPSIEWPEQGYLSAPEAVHWALTYKCHKSCPDCYARSYKNSFASELSLPDVLKMVRMMAERGVFQLALGGGEPFLRKDLEEIVRYASEQGLTVHVTTGNDKLAGTRLDRLADHLKTLQIGVRVDELLSNQSSDAADRLKVLVSQVSERNIGCGANLIMTRSAIPKLDRLVEILIDCGFRQFTLLRYKPHGNKERWLAENPDHPALSVLQKKIPALQISYPDAHFRIDCALCFLERHLVPETALNSGMRGCVAFSRIMSIAPDGSVYPCSQLVGRAFRAGNLTTMDLGTIWRHSRIANKYRNFRHAKEYQKSRCGKCRASNFCGGCRVFAKDSIGPDPGCPQSLVDP